MIPGTTSKCSESLQASAASIDIKTDIVMLTGTTDLETLVPHFGGGFSGHVLVVPVDGDVDTVTTGNIAIAVTMPQNRVTVLAFSKRTNTWYPGAIS